MSDSIMQYIDFDTIRYHFGLPWYHVLIEIVLAVYIIRLFRSRRTLPKAFDTQLTDKEKEELIEDWHPQPLVPVSSFSTPAARPSSASHVFGRRNSTVYDGVNLVARPVLDGKICKYTRVLFPHSGDANFNCKVESGCGDGSIFHASTTRESALSAEETGILALNAASMNFLNLNGRSDIEDAAMRTIDVYGVGSCGPRGFYGTAEIHLELEQRLAEFFGCEEAALYSFAFATIASAIPSYSKRDDIIFADEGVSFATQQGIIASRSHVQWFKHNDMKDLERILAQHQLDERKDTRKAKATKKFLVAEGLYAKYGDICPLPELIELRKRYKLRLFLEESLSFGTLGNHGRGVTDYYNVDITEVDLICGSLENAVAAGGGFCVGSHYVVDHQRLSGSGYCFSASLPPLLAAASLKALSLMQNDDEISPNMFDRLQQVSIKLHEKLTIAFRSLPTRRGGNAASVVELVGAPEAAIKHIRLVRSVGAVRNLNWAERENLLRRIVIWACRERKVLLTTAAYVPDKEHLVPEPSLRLAVNCDFTDAEVELLVSTLKDAFAQIAAFIPSTVD